MTISPSGSWTAKKGEVTHSRTIIRTAIILFLGAFQDTENNSYKKDKVKITKKTKRGIK